MNDNEKAIATFESRVRQLILKYQELKTENQQLRGELAQSEQEREALQAKLVQAENDYNSLKMAKMIEITDGDLQSAKDRVARLIRDVNKCIAVLSDET